MRPCYNAARKKQKIIQTSSICRKISHPRPQTSEQEQNGADENTSWSNKIWIKLEYIIRIIRRRESPINEQTQEKAPKPEVHHGEEAAKQLMRGKHLITQT